MPHFEWIHQQRQAEGSRITDKQTPASTQDDIRIFEDIFELYLLRGSPHCLLTSFSKISAICVVIAFIVVVAIIVLAPLQGHSHKGFRPHATTNTENKNNKHVTAPHTRVNVRNANNNNKSNQEACDFAGAINIENWY